MTEELTLVELAQGSQEWHALRRTKRPASITPMILGTSKWGDRGDAYDAMVGDTVEDDTFLGVLRDYGNRTEPNARELASKLIGAKGFPVVGYRGEYLASLDFFTSVDGRRVGVEIKCPYMKDRSATWKAAQKGIIEPGYSDQIQHQTEVFALDEAYLLVYISDDKYLLLKHDSSPARWAEIKKAWDKFDRDHLSKFERPNPYTKRTDDAWKAAAEAFTTAKQAVDEAEETLEAARVAILKLADGVKSEGFGVRANFYQSRGSVDYKSILNKFDSVIRAADPAYTPEVFRKAPRSTEAVTIIKPE